MATVLLLREIVRINGLEISAQDKDLESYLATCIKTPGFYGGYIPDNPGVRDNFIADWVAKTFDGKVSQYSKVPDQDQDNDFVY